MLAGVWFGILVKGALAPVSRQSQIALDASGALFLDSQLWAERNNGVRGLCGS